MAHRHLDLAGAITVTAGLVALVFALVRTETYSWGSAQVLVPLALGRGAPRRLPRPPGPLLQGSARPAAHLPVPLGLRRQRGDADDVRRAVRVLVLRDALHAARARATARCRPVSPSCLRRCLIAAGAQVTSRLVPRFGPRLLILVGTLVAGGRVGLAGPDHDRQHVRGRPPRAVRAHRSGHGTGRDTDRRGGNGGSAAGGGGTRLRVAQHVTHRRVRPSASPRSPRSRPTAPRVCWPGWRPRRPTRRRPSPTAMRSPSRSPPCAGGHGRGRPGHAPVTATAQRAGQGEPTGLPSARSSSKRPRSRPDPRSGGCGPAGRRPWR